MKTGYIAGMFPGLLCLGIVTLAAPLQGAEPTPNPDFTFKRVKPPAKGSTNRIRVQIGQGTSGQALPTVSAAAPVGTSATGALDWYWAGVSPLIKDSKPGRLARALAYLDKGPGGKSVPTPRLQPMQDLAQNFGIDILKATIGTGVSPALVLAVIGVESAGRTDAVSKAGATGLMQLMPDTAKRFGVGDATEAAQNIKGGVAYLDWLMKEFDRDPVLVLAAYNAGENAVRKNAGVPPFAETRDYVPRVLAAWTVARGLCMTPPELISDGCVFASVAARPPG
jgi:hypothetical protein